MFRVIVKTVIKALDKTLSELKRAYDETYGNFELTKEFKAKVDEIKKENKEAFIKAAIKVEIMMAIATNDYPTANEITKRAEKRWKEALEEGALDELYNLSERSKNE